jgi:3-methyladenine DNA glycosylase AlkD
LTLDPLKSAKEISSKICILGGPEGNSTLQSYLGSPYKVLGLSVPRLRGITKDFAKQYRKTLQSNELNKLTNRLWLGVTFEEKTAGIMLLDEFPKLMDEETWNMVDSWIEEAVGWAVCDALGSGPISTMTFLDGSRKYGTQVLGWTDSRNFWRRRIAAYSLRRFVSAGDLDWPFLLLRKILYDKEFWVQRAVGTWLRECWKKDRARTEQFLVKNAHGLSRTVITVATERAPMAFRAGLRVEASKYKS